MATHPTSVDPPQLHYSAAFAQGMIVPAGRLVRSTGRPLPVHGTHPTRVSTFCTRRLAVIETARTTQRMPLLSSHSWWSRNARRTAERTIDQKIHTPITTSTR
jgi:hypothetical protein